MKEITLAYILYNDGRRSFLGLFYKEDREAFNELMDEMQILCQKDESINSFGFEDVPILGGLAEDIKFLYHFES